jgi:hypothetical protein
MFFGLTELHENPARLPRQQFTTLVDPFIAEGFKAVMAIGQLTKLIGWSRSYYTLDGHVSSLLQYNKVIRPEPIDDIWNITKSESFELFSNISKVNALSAKTDNQGFDQVKFHESTSAGYSYHDSTSQYPTHKGKPNGNNHKRAKRIAAKIVHQCKSEYDTGTFNQFIDKIPDDSTPDIAFTRTQLVELPQMKVRNVFGECFHYVILEGLFAQPLIQNFIMNETFYFIGKDPVTGVPDLINSIPDRDQYFLTIDWSAFDASVQPYEIDLAFDLLESMLIFPDTDTKLVFQYVRRLFMKRKIASPDGRVFMRYGGVPSGSFFTHVVGSIINWTRMRYLFRKNHIDYGLLKTHGDDGLAELFNADEDAINLMVKDAELLGWYIKVEKSQLFKDRYRLIFLGRSSRHGSNFREADRCLRLMYYPEYPVIDPQISIARLKAIDADSGYNIPMIQNVYSYLVQRYGDHGVPLPREFRRFNQAEYVNVSI